MPNVPPIQLARIDDLFLDPGNPRLGRHEIAKGLSQEEILTLMQDSALDELAVSFLESGFWPQEALIVVREPLDPKSSSPVPVVVEGNRRLAALKMLQLARVGQSVPSRWRDLVNGVAPETLDQLAEAPFIEMPDRRSVQAYLGFRHVTGIKEWSPAEKAQFISHLVDDEKLTYEQVRRRIGSKAPTVRQHYIAYRLLLQMEDESGIIDLSRVEERFSVLYRSVRTAGVQKYLALDIDAPPERAIKPVPNNRLEQLARLTVWLFGTDRKPPVMTDSRDLDDFARVLESENGVAYLERTSQPNLESAKRAAGVSQSQVAETVELAAVQLEEVLGVVHQFQNDPLPRLLVAVKRLGADALQLLKIFPQIAAELQPEKK